MDMKPLLQNRWLLIIGAVGILCLILGSTFGSRPTSQPPAVTPSAAQPLGVNIQSAVTGGTTLPSATSDPALLYASMYDKQLAAILATVQGVNSVNVMVALDTSEALSFANNVDSTTTDQRSGGQSSTTVTRNQQVFTVKNSDGSETPYVYQTVQPRVRGVLVTVNAVDFIVAKSEIIDAIQHLLDVPAYKISVEPQKVKG